MCLFLNYQFEFYDVNWGHSSPPPPLMTIVIVLLNLSFTGCSYFTICNLFLLFGDFDIVHLFLPLGI